MAEAMLSKSKKKSPNMKKQNKFWNGRIPGICGAGIQFWKACFNCLFDKLFTYFIRQNLHSVGKGVVIQRGVIIRYPLQIKLGDNVRIGRGVEINTELTKSELVIGEGTWIGRKCHLDFTGGLVIGQNCTLSENVTIFTHGHGFVPRSKPLGSSLKIGNEVWIGANVTILQDVSEIGDNSIIGTGSVITKSIPSGVIVAGNPGRVIHKIEHA
jgi:acetyltransferase-like isoleucine patch superfamily enzyme